MKKDKLKSLKMPEKMSEEMPEEMGMELDGMEDEEDAMEEMKMDEEESPLAEFDDEELLAEIKKRGLMSELEGEEEDMEEEEDFLA